MIRARALAACLALAALAAACGQKGDLKLPAAKTQAPPAAAPDSTTPPASK